MDHPLFRAEKSVWLTVFVIEASFIGITRVVLSRYSINSLEAELIRTSLRLLAVWVYWRLLRDRIQSQPVAVRPLLRPVPLLSFALFLSVPLLVGDPSSMTPMTRAVYAVTSIAVALKEEISFRALVQGMLAKRFGHLMAILIATVLFTAYHIGAIPFALFAYGQVVAAGLVLGMVYARTQNLWLVVWLHTLYDALWSATPVYSPPLPYSIGLAILSVCTLLVLTWSWPTIRPRQANQ